jgi:RES domain-containing protein
VIAYRIGSRAHPLLDGRGAALSNNARWNSRGRFVIYGSEHYATALLEKAAQLGVIRLPRTLVFARLDIPSDVAVEELTADDLPGWDDDDRTASRQYGDRWYDEQRSVALLVPALAAPGLESNVLINQRHPEFRRVVASSPEPVRCHPKLLV